MLVAFEWTPRARLHNLRCNISVGSFLSIYLVMYGNWSRRSWVNEAFSVSGRVGVLYLRSKGAQRSIGLMRWSNRFSNVEGLGSEWFYRSHQFEISLNSRADMCTNCGFYGKSTNIGIYHAKGVLIDLRYSAKQTKFCDTRIMGNPKWPSAESKYLLICE